MSKELTSIESIHIHNNRIRVSVVLRMVVSDGGKYNATQERYDICRSIVDSNVSDFIEEDLQRLFDAIEDTGVVTSVMGVNYSEHDIDFRAPQNLHRIATAVMEEAIERLDGLVGGFLIEMRSVTVSPHPIIKEENSKSITVTVRV